MYICNNICNTIRFLLAGLHILEAAPQWAQSNNFMQWVDLQALVAHNTVQEVNGLHQEKNTTDSTNLSSKDIHFTKLSQRAHDDKIVSSSPPINSVKESLFILPENLQNNQKQSLNTCEKDFTDKTQLNLLNTVKVTIPTYELPKDKSKILSTSQKEICYHDTDISWSNCVSKCPTNIENTTELKIASDKKDIEHSIEVFNCKSASSKADNEPLNLVINPSESAQNHAYSETEVRPDSCSQLSNTNKKAFPLDRAILRHNHSLNTETCTNTKYTDVDYGLLKLSDLNGLSHHSDKGKELLKTINKLYARSEINTKTAINADLKQEGTHVLDKYITEVLPSRLSSDKQKKFSWSRLQSNVKYNSNIKKEYCAKEEAHKSENTDLVTVNKPTLSNWEVFEMSGQYPGHSRPPVGTPPPQTVWNHLTMTQGQGNLNFKLLIFSEILIILNM